jgi:peptidoglycan/xylan/chitin deacetylase (PgdA/CDA1 family)
MRALCFTVDLDRDVNIPIPDGIAAGSIDRGSGTEARFSSSEKGLLLLLDLLDEMAIKATFFAEADTLRKIDIGILSKHDVGIHGVEHEDLTLIKGTQRKRAILKESSEAVKDAVGRPPECFRAPYMKADNETIGMLPEFGINIDSSRYTTMSRSLIPGRMECGVWEMPVPEGMDASGKKIAAYLWPMHELKRPPADYVELASQMEEGAFVLATHTWHIVESRESGMMTNDGIKKNIGNVRKVLEGVMDDGIRPMTMTDVRRTMAHSL